METAQLLFQLIRVAVCGEAPAQELKTACTPEALEQVFAMAARHDLAHLAGQGASKLPLADSEPLQKCKKAAMQAFMRHARQEYTYQKVCALLEQAQIPFIPLKGSVLRAHYPEGWMRTSCDMDILVHEEALEQASALLEQNGWTFREKTSHDLAFSSADGVHLELHYSTIEDYVSEAGKKIMEGIWDDAAPLPGKQYHMVISDPLFYYYHMAHMAKHFVHGGCGIRTFLDIWILNHRMEFDPAARNALLEEGKLSAFARGAEALAEGWFSGAPMDENALTFQNFILSGGTYGTVQNRVTLQQEQKGGKLKFALERIFLPYDILKHQFTVLQTHKWLTPVFHLVRWFRLIFCGGMKRSVHELKTTAAVSDDAQAAVRTLLKHLEL